MRILHVGNPEAFKNLAICEHSLRRGDAVHYFSPVPPREEVPGIVYHYSPAGRRSRLGTLQNVLRLRRVIREVRPDLLHAHNVSGYGWMAALSGFSPLLLHAYGGDVLPEQMTGARRHQRWLSRHAVRRAAGIVVTGRHMVRAVAENFGIEEGKIRVIPRGVDLGRFRPFPRERRGELRRAFGIPEDAFVVLSPRYLFDSVYNIDVILEAFAALTERHPEILLLQMHRHAEEDPAYRSVTALMARLGIEGGARLVPMVPSGSMADLYNLADLCVSVPSSDGFPVTVLEASACGVPLVVSRLAFTDEWFEEGKNGLVVPPGDAPALAGAVEALFSDRRRAKAFATHNQAKVRAEADGERCMDRLRDLYRELI